jgi:hypothetical protein
MRHNPDIDKANLENETPLMYAVRIQGDIGFCFDLIKGGCNMELPYGDGNRVLHALADNPTAPRSHSLAALMLRHGADVNAPGFSGRTPLHCALYATRFFPDSGDQGCRERALTTRFCEMLLEHGADPRIVDWYGASPREIAGLRMPEVLPLMMDCKELLKQQAVRITDVE